MKVKPFLRWAGGKQKHVDLLLENAPKHNLKNRYFEPFLGAGSLFFSNGFENALISDINPQLINTYRQIKQDHIGVYNLLSEHDCNFKSDKEYYYKIRHLFNKDRNQVNLEQAARFIFLLHSNYNGMYRVNKEGGYNVPVGRLNPFIPKLSHLKLIQEKLENVYIECANYQLIGNKVKKNDFVYLDPPYPPYEWSNLYNQYTVNYFSKENHESLREFANQLVAKGCNVLISYPDIEFIRQLYCDWNIVKLDVFRSISCKKERKKISELIIKSY